MRQKKFIYGNFAHTVFIYREKEKIKLENSKYLENGVKYRVFTNKINLKYMFLHPHRSKHIK